MNSDRLASLALEIQSINSDIGHLEDLLKDGVKGITLRGNSGDISISNGEYPSGFEELKAFIYECIESCKRQKDLTRHEIIKEVTGEEVVNDII